jgi:EmrB/QacA subfamily drug resistance transporter
MTTEMNPKLSGAAGPPPAPQPPVPAEPPADVPPPYWGTTLVLLTGTFISVLDFFIVNVTIPSLQRDLGVTSAGIEWVVAGFALAFGSGLIIGGRLGDIFGRRLMFVVGLVLFTATSALCGAAPNVSTLVVGRVLQGASAALMSPQILTILGTTFGRHPALRLRAFSAYGVTMGLAGVFGQLIGGLLIKWDLFGWGWRTCFLINIPIGIVTLLLVPRFVPESKAPGKPRLDLVGMVVIAAALTAVVLPLIEGRQHGWPAWSWISLAASIVLFAVFAGWESAVGRRNGSPLVDLGLFKERAFTAGLLAQLVFWCGQASFFLVFALYLQFGRQLSPLGAGTIFIAVGAGYMATSMSARFIAPKLGRQTIALGGVLRLIGCALLILTVAKIGVGHEIAWLIPALVIDGAGQGMAVAPLATTVLSRITPQHAGAASGVLTTGIQVGNALGVAVIGVIFYGVLNHTHGLIGYAHAFNWSLVFIMGVALALVLFVQLLPKLPGAVKK